MGSCPETDQGADLVSAVKLHARALAVANQPMLPRTHIFVPVIESLEHSSGSPIDASDLVKSKPARSAEVT